MNTTAGDHRTSTLNAQPEDAIDTVVLQPCGRLTGIGGATFRTTLARAIAQSTSVVVDLLWVEAIDDQGVATLLAGMRQACAAGRSLAFLGMDAITRTALDKGWEQQRDVVSSTQIDLFSPEFEQFLDGYKAAKAARATAFLKG
ncbi:STAS domain-containing protein [Phormidesmis sp. 146-12]